MTTARGFRPRVPSLFAAAALLLGACSPSTERASSTGARLEVLEGRVLVAGKAVGGSTPLRAGSRVVVVQGGSARLHLSGGRVVDLGPSRGTLAGPDDFRLAGGRLLAAGAQGLKVRAGAATIELGRGFVKIVSGIATRVVAYGGTARLEIGGVSLGIPPLRQAVVAGGILPRSVRPLTIDAADPWDRRFLQPAIDLDSRLENFGRGLDAQLLRTTGPFFAAPAAPARLDFLQPFVNERRSDLLIALIIASRAAPAREVGVEQLFGEVMVLFGEGATWGLIAMEYGLSPDAVFDGLVEAVRRATAVPGTPAPSPPPTFAPPPRGSPSPRPTRRPSPVPTVAGPGRPPTQPPAGGREPPPPGEPGLVEQVVEALLGVIPLDLGL